MFKEYFGDWIGVIDEGRLYKVLKTLSVGYSKMAISPAQEDIFKAFYKKERGVEAQDGNGWTRPLSTKRNCNWCCIC